MTHEPTLAVSQEAVLLLAEALRETDVEGCDPGYSYVPQAKALLAHPAFARFQRNHCADAEGVRLDIEELSIAHGQQVTATFKDPDDAFALFNELKARAGDTFLAKMGDRG